MEETVVIPRCDIQRLVTLFENGELEYFQHSEE